MIAEPEQYFVHDDGIFPNNSLPVLFYRNALRFPLMFHARWLEMLFSTNNWSNNWRAGIFIYPHYHSNTHEVVGVYKGKTALQISGPTGPILNIAKGDVIIIPAGVAHRNMGSENDVQCVGGYPGGRHYDMNYGRQSERPAADRNIAQVPLPSSDPLLGPGEGLARIWGRPK